MGVDADAGGHVAPDDRTYVLLTISPGFTDGYNRWTKTLECRLDSSLNEKPATPTFFPSSRVA
jgi:hypothetical protein